MVVPWPWLALIIKPLIAQVVSTALLFLFCRQWEPFSVYKCFPYKKAKTCTDRLQFQTFRPHGFLSYQQKSKPLLLSLVLVRFSAMKKTMRRWSVFLSPRDTFKHSVSTNRDCLLRLWSCSMRWLNSIRTVQAATKDAGVYVLRVNLVECVLFGPLPPVLKLCWYFGCQTVMQNLYTVYYSVSCTYVYTTSCTHPEVAVACWTLKAMQLYKIQQHITHSIIPGSKRVKKGFFSIRTPSLWVRSPVIP